MSGDKLDQILAELRENSVQLATISSALWPDEGQPGILTQHRVRMDEMEDAINELKGWRSYVIGAWGAVTLLFGTWLGFHGKHGG